MPIRTNTSAPTAIDPAKLYSLRQFICDSGISYTRIRTAARRGSPLTTLKTGNRVFVRGRDGIAFIEQLAAMDRVERPRC